MKKILLTLLSLIAVVAHAENYKVTVTTKQIIEYRDNNGDVVDSEEIEGNVMVFEAVADSPYEAENVALKQCQNACDSGIPILVAKDVKRKGVICDKYVKTIPYRVKAE